MTDPHYRRCFDCGHINMYRDAVIPECLCRMCKSADTRRMKNPPPLWGMSSVVYVPESVAVCPECGGELTASNMHAKSNGRPIAADIEIMCRMDADEPHAKIHRHHQDKWQPVRDAVAKWCDAGDAE